MALEEPHPLAALASGGDALDEKAFARTAHCRARGRREEADHHAQKEQVWV